MNFVEALDVKVEKIERPPLAPIGHYIFIVSKPAILGETKNGDWDTVDFPLQGVEALDDVDPTLLSEAGGASSVNLRQRFMFSRAQDEEGETRRKRSLFNMRMFLEEHLGLDAKGKSLKELISEAQGAQCVANIQHRPNPDNPEIVYAEIGRTAPIS